MLEEKLNKFHPKLLIKTLEPSKMILKWVSKKEELKPFFDEDIYLINVGEYEGQSFSCKVTLQTMHVEMNREPVQLAIMESSDD